MEYYRTLHLEKEPFSNSPDPGFFFNSRQHREALQQLEISIRLRRGLNVITGDVGTGKTTVCRQLIRKIDHDDTIRYFLILDPGFASAPEFLSAILTQFTGIIPSKEDAGNEILLKEKIKTFLFSRGVDQDMITVLMIDEGQKLPFFCLETLRELLNYETNDKKLLQIVIFAQNEFNPIIGGMENFMDRINFRYTFTPLGFRETREFIQFRIEQSADPKAFEGKKLPGFSLPALWAVHRYTRGYPRKIINLCHHVILAMIIKHKTRAGYFFVRSCAGQVFFRKPKALVFRLSTALVLFFMAAGILNFTDIPGMIIEKFDRAVFTESAAAPEKPAADLPQRGDPVEPAVEKVVKQVVKPEGLPPSIPETPAALSPPSLLGRMKVPKNETLYNMLATVYGSFSKTCQDRFLDKNPDIVNPDLIFHGLWVSFPVLQAPAGWTPENSCLVYAREDRFETAYEKARNCRSKGVDTRIISAWDPGGYLYLVVLDRIFVTAEAACDTKAGLAERIELEEENIAALIGKRIIL